MTDQGAALLWVSSGWCRRFSRLLRSRWRAVMAVCLVMMFAGDATAEPWPIKDFEVVAVAAAGEYRFPTRERLARDVQRLVQETGITDPYFPTLFRTLPVDVTEQTAIENFLGETAAQFEAWGFRPAALEPVIEGRDGNPAFRVFLISNLENAAGEYHVSCVNFTGRILLLNRSSIMSGNAISTRGFQTIAHELFHAVQGAYPFFECDGGPWLGDWIVEGQARAVGWDTAARLRPLDTSSNAFERWGQRDYNKRLQVPMRRFEGSTIDPYGTSSFWRYLAERHAGRAVGYKPGPEEAPVDYGYLPMLFAGGRVARDCDQLRDPCDAEVDWLNARLLTAFGADLRTVFTNYAEALALYGKHRTGLTDAYTWRKRVFSADECHAVPFGDPWSRTIHRDVVPRFEANSIQCFVVTFNEFDNDVLIEFKATAPPGGIDVGNLNFAVAGRPMQARRAQVKINNDTREPSVAWVARVPADEATYITLTNVADIPSRSSRMTNLPYTVTVLKEFASMGSGGGGPSASDIDAPLPFELDTIRQSYLFPGPLQEHADLGMDEVCLVQFIFEDSRTGDGLVLKMDIEGPLRPGAYPIFEGGVGDTAENPGRFFAAFGIGKGNALGQGFEMSYKPRGGTVTIDSVSSHFVRGTASIVGHNGKPTNCLSPSGERAYFDAVGNLIPCPGPRDLVIEAKFGVIPEMTSGLERLGKSLDQCVNETPLPPSPTSNDPDTSDDPSTDDPSDGPSTGTPPEDPPPPEEGGGDEAGDGAGSDADAGLSGDDTDAADDTEAGEGEPGAAEIGAAKQGPRWAIIRASGGVQDTVLMASPQQTGGCSGSSPLRIGLFEGQPSDPDWASISINTEGVIATGQTGTFALGEFNWDYGTVPVKNMPAHLNIRAPNRFTGDATLELTVHDPNLDTRRLQGIVRAPQMSNREGQTTNVEVEFGVNWSCGLR